MIGGLTSLAALAALGIGAAMTPGNPPVTNAPGASETRADRAIPAAATRAPTMPADLMAQLLDTRPGAPAPSYPPNTGWTNRRYQRAALKRRNRITNRRNHRG